MKFRHTIVWTLILLLTLGLLFVAGCGGGGGTKTTEQTPTTGGNEGATSEPSPNPEKIVRINASLPLNPDPAVGASSIDSAMVFNVYDALVFPDIDGTILPHVATEWETSEDGLTYTFHLRDDVKFHDGSLLTAEDVAFSMNRALVIGQGFSYLWTAYVQDAEALDDVTVQINMKQTYGPFVATLVRLGILNKDLVLENKKDGSYGEFGDYGMAWLTTHDAGSGPYMIGDINVSEYVKCTKFADYWQPWGENAPEGYTVQAVNDTATVRTLMSNQELEITDEWQAQDSLQAMDAMDGIDLTYMYTGALANFEMNTKKAPTDDVHLRKALAYLYDYNTATQYIYPGTKQAVGNVSASYQGHNPDVTLYTYDEEKAKAELALSKYADTIGDYTIEMHYSADVPDEEKLCLLLQEAAAKLGVKMTITATPWTTMISEAASPETTPHIMVMMPSDSYSEAGAVLSLRYHSSTTGTFQQYEWLQNAEIDAAIEAALGELDKDTRLEMYKQIQADIADLCPTISILEWPEQRCYQSGYLYWPEAEAEINAPIMGRSLYFRTMEFTK